MNNNKKKKMTFFRLIKSKTNRFKRWLIKPYKNFRKRQRKAWFYWWGEHWYDIGEITEDWWEDDTVPAADFEDFYLLKKARYFYDKYTNAYYFSHWGGSEDNYEYYADWTHLRDDLEEEYGGITTKFNIPFYEYYNNIVAECEAFRMAFLNDFRIESPWDLVDEDRTSLIEDPMFTALPPFYPSDHPQHNHEHEWIHRYHDEDQYTMNKWDQEEGELLVVGHWTRDEYEFHEEIPFWTDPRVDTLPLFKLRRKWWSHGPVTSKAKVGYNLDLIINYSLKDYYGFLAYDDNMNISFYLARRWGYHEDKKIWLPTDIYAQKQLDAMVEYQLNEGLLAPYFYTWAAPTHQEVREYIIQRSNFLWVQARQRIFFKLGKISSYVKEPFLKLKIWSLKKKVTAVKTVKRAWLYRSVALTWLTSWLVKNFVWFLRPVLQLIWGIFWGTLAVLLTIEFLHYCLDEHIITVWMVGKKTEGIQEIGPAWLYIGVLLHGYYIFWATIRFGKKFMGNRADFIWKEEEEAQLQQYKGFLANTTRYGGHWRYRSAHGANSLISFTQTRDDYILSIGLAINLVLIFFDDQMAFAWYLEDWLHIQIAIYDWPILNGDVPI